MGVKNLNETPAIGSLEVTNHRTTAATTDDFVMNSSTLVAGETATITDILSTSGDEINVTGGEVYTSSNVGVATVSSSGVITAIAPGTVSITVTSGLQSFTKTFTVTGTARAASSVTPAKASYTLSNPTSAAGGYTVSVTAKDQYGDPVAATIASSSTIGTIADATSSAVDGKATITLPAQGTNGTYPVYLKVGGVQFGAFNVVVTNDTAVHTTKIESSDSSLDLGGDKDTVVTVNQYTTAGGYIESLTGAIQAAGATVNLVDTTGATYTLTAQDNTVADVEVVAAGSSVTVIGKKVGTTKLVLKDAAGVDQAYFDVTVTDSTVSVTGLTWKNPGKLEAAAKAVKLGDALTITTVDNDDIVSGVALSKTTTSKVRVDEDNDAALTNAIALYLDVNDDGNYVATDDVILGQVSAVVDPAFVGGTALTPSATVTGYVATNMFSRALAVGDKGNLIFTFTKRGASAPLSSNVVVVDVK